MRTKTILYVLKACRNGKTKYNQIMITGLKLVVTSFGLLKTSYKALCTFYVQAF